MKKIRLSILLLLIMGLNMNAFAQESVIEDINYTQLEQFIEMAKRNHPKNKIIALMEKKAKSVPTIEALTLLDMANASYYYRPNDRTSINPENPYSVNGLQLSVNVSLGTLIGIPFRIKQAKIDYEIAKLESEDYEKLLVSEVKNRYYEYILQLKELKLRTQTAQDSKGMADDIALRFERGELEIGIYNTSKASFNSAKSSEMQTEVTYLKARDQLEEIIGKKLTELETN